MRFRSPQEVAGTAFLMLERDKGESEQHIYLPGLKRTRRIVGREREGSFMGSDFSYADFERRDTRESTQKRLPDEDLSGVKTYVLESTPKKAPSSTYSKIETWVRQDNFLPLRIRFYDKSGQAAEDLLHEAHPHDGGPAGHRGSRRWSTSRPVTQPSWSSTICVHATDIPDTAFTPTALEHG